MIFQNNENFWHKQMWLQIRIEVVHLVSSVKLIFYSVFLRPFVFYFGSIMYTK